MNGFKERLGMMFVEGERLQNEIKDLLGKMNLA